MDLNYLYERHQVSLILAERAVTQESRRAHGRLAEAYALRIAAAKSQSTGGAGSWNG